MVFDKEINKPEPIAIGDKIMSHNQGTDIETTISELEKGNYILIDGLYNDGIELLKQLHWYLKQKLPNKTFQEQQAYRSEYHRLSNLILLEVVGHVLRAKKSPKIGWFEQFYPENSHFLLTFPQVQGLNSSWQWYINGVSFPVLRNKIHPYYGVYFPTRFDHLIMFDNWLKRYEGPKKTAIDVGVGCGVLSLQMEKHGFQKVFATDINPNAIYGLKEHMGKTKLSRKIELDTGHLFGKWNKPSELIVFNPPWLPASKDIEGLDGAIYYDKNLLPDFFEAAKEMLLPDGKLVVIFSNLAQIANLTTEHPIEKELAQGGRFKLERTFTKSVSAASDKTKRDQQHREDEIVELWELTHA